MSVNNSFPAFHTTGAVHNYIRVNGFSQATGNTSINSPSGEIWYLGTCETQPIMKLTPHSQPVFNDIGGRSIPMQETYDGTDADLGLMMSRFSQNAYLVLQMFANAPGTSQLQPNPGAETFLSRGSLMYGPRTFELWQYFSFFGTIAATPQLPVGYYWPQVKLGAHGPEKFGTEGQVLLVTGKGTPRWFASSGSAASRFVTWSQNTVDFPAETMVAR